MHQSPTCRLAAPARQKVSWMLCRLECAQQPGRHTFFQKFYQAGSSFLCCYALQGLCSYAGDCNVTVQALQTTTAATLLGCALSGPSSTRVLSSGLCPPAAGQC